MVGWPQAGKARGRGPSAAVLPFSHTTIVAQRTLYWPRMRERRCPTPTLCFFGRLQAAMHLHLYGRPKVDGLMCARRQVCQATYCACTMCVRTALGAALATGAHDPAPQKELTLHVDADVCGGGGAGSAAWPGKVWI